MSAPSWVVRYCGHDGSRAYLNRRDPASLWSKSRSAAWRFRCRDCALLALEMAAEHNSEPRPRFRVVRLVPRKRGG